ncbi:MAG: hypothetical protein PHF86_03675 [Candidatus Nanoarchaeia archaeon]|nr:hypothetical protein [Candidatus Nanoarchaeia archaeon]
MIFSRKWFREYVDKDRVTPFNLIGAFVKERIADILWGTAFIVAFSAISNKYYQRYNSEMNQIQNQINQYTVSITNSKNKGTISEQDAQRTIDQLNRKKQEISPGREIINGIYSLEPGKIMAGIKGVIKMNRDPNIANEQLNNVAVEYNDTIKKNNKFRSYLEASLDNYGSSCSSQALQNYQVALAQFKQSGLDSNQYQTKFLTLENVCKERAYFADIESKVLKKTKELEYQGITKEAIAVEIGYYFSDLTEGSSTQHRNTLKEKTPILSQKVSKTLNYHVQLEDYL